MIYIFARTIKEATSEAMARDLSRGDYRPITNERTFRGQVHFEKGDTIIVKHRPLYSEFLAYRGQTWIQARGLVVEYCEDKDY